MKKLIVCLMVVVLASLTISFSYAGYDIQPTDVKRISTQSRGATLRSSPTNLGAENKITLIPANTELDVEGMVGIWYYVCYNGNYGFVGSGSDWTRVIERGSTSTQSSQSTNSNTQQSVIQVAEQVDSDSGWYCPKCGRYMSASDNFCPNDATPNPFRNGDDNEVNNDDNYVNNDEIYDMGIPNLNGKTYSMDQMNLDIYWVQTQLKATGIYYQGDAWDITGNLGDHTMQEIASFMQGRGYGGHSGCVDQTVINELAKYLGSRVVPVYVGGFYRHMDSIMTGGHKGSMQKINSNLIDMVPHVTVGGRWIQCCLSKLGYYKGSIDGMYGEQTEKAVNDFQKAYGFEKRNYVTLGVARAMIEACYNNGYYLDDLP